MGILSWMIFGLIIGALARFLMPGRDPMGCLMTMGLGIVGSLLGGFLGQMMGLYPPGVTGGGIIMSIIGAVLVLAVYRSVAKRE